MRRGLPSAEAAQTSFFKSTIDCEKMRKDKSYEIDNHILSVQLGYCRRSITERARSSDSVTRYPLFGASLSFWSRLDVEARHAPERMHDE